VKRAIIFSAIMCTTLGAALALGRPAAQAQSGATKLPLRPASPAQAGTTKVTLNPAADTYVARGVKDPQGGMFRLRSGVRVGVPYFTLMRFDFPATMGAGAKITSAKVRIYCVESLLDADKTPGFQLSVVRQPWDDTILEKDQPGVEGPKLTWEFDECPPTGEWKELVGEADMIEVLQRWFDGDKTNHGWELSKKDDRAGLFAFESVDTGGRYPLGRGPQLILEFTGGATITPTVTSTDTPSSTPTPSDTPEPTETFTPSVTPPPSDTPTPSDTPEPTDPPTFTPTASSTPTPGDIYLPLVLVNHVLGSDAAGLARSRPIAAGRQPYLPLTRWLGRQR